MFVYSVRASTVKFFAVIVLSLAVLVGVLIFGGMGADTVSASSDAIDFKGIKTNDDRVRFISGFGITVDEAPIETVDFSIPESFDKIIMGYNELQRRQGLDLSRYKNKKVTRYTYSVSDYEGYDGEVNVNLIVYRNTVIGCDVSSAEPSGFVKPLINLGTSEQ